MRYCLSNRQEAKYLKEADAIRMEYRDIDSIFDLIEEYNDKEILIYLPIEGEIDYNLLTAAAKKANIVAGCVLEEQICKCIENDIPFFFNWLISTMIDVRRLTILGSRYILLDAPLFFNLPKVLKVIGLDNEVTKIMAVANRAKCGMIESNDGIHGIWILPQSIKDYESYISMITFDASAEQERAYFRIYKEQNWYGKVSDLIKDIGNYNATSNAILPEALKNRIYCCHRCEELGVCHICDNVFMLASYSTEKLEKLK